MKIYKYNIDVTEFEFKPWFRKEVYEDEALDAIFNDFNRLAFFRIGVIKTG